jgi:hypothetical protein
MPAAAMMGQQAEKFHCKMVHQGHGKPADRCDWWNGQWSLCWSSFADLPDGPFRLENLNPRTLDGNRKILVSGASAQIRTHLRS